MDGLVVGSCFELPEHAFRGWDGDGFVSYSLIHTIGRFV
jgi:hypothetical protein